VNNFNTIAILIVAYLAVFAESFFRGPRHVLGAQIDLLPALMVCSALTTGIAAVAIVAIAGGLWYDSLSANPLGISVLPLFAVGAAIHHWRDLILRERRQAQLILGFAASALVPVLVVVSLLIFGSEPALDWWSPWRWLIMTVGGGLATPVLFVLFARLHRAFNYQRQSSTAFRQDREIKQGPRHHSDD
jgi:cell shape-determining protein MreD